MNKQIDKLLNMKLPTICKDCMEIIRKPSQVGNVDRVLCVCCERERKAVEQDKCISCEGKGALRLYWGQCEKCFNKHIED